MSLRLVHAGVFPCTYCGETATTVDHVPPILLKNEVPEKDRFCVAACLECNTTLGAKRLFDVLDRQIWLRLRYKEKYARILATRDRLPEELAEFGYALRSQLEAVMEEKQAVLARLSYKFADLDGIRLPYYLTARSSKEGSSRLEAARGLPGAIPRDFEDALEELIVHDPWINDIDLIS